MNVQYGRRASPCFGCKTCGDPYYLPQSVRWDEKELAKCAAEARERGWTVPEDGGAVYCPLHDAVGAQRTGG